MSFIASALRSVSPFHHGFGSSLSMGPVRFVRQVPLVLKLWYQWRRWRFSRSASHWRQFEPDSSEGHVHLANVVLPHNLPIDGTFARDRSERLMNVLKSIMEFDRRNSKVVCVGPRNEAELLLMTAHGFTLKNLTGVDLFSYSPLIEVMDMHDLQFENDTFDLYYNSYTLVYSYDVAKACAEALRVTTDRGLVAIAFNRLEEGLPSLGTGISGGLAELFGYFGDSIDHVYWQEEFINDPKNGPGKARVSTVFRITKRPQAKT